MMQRYSSGTRILLPAVLLFCLVQAGEDILSLHTSRLSTWRGNTSYNPCC
jgi:hypothetical protein